MCVFVRGCVCDCVCMHVYKDTHTHTYYMSIWTHTHTHLHTWLLKKARDDTMKKPFGVATISRFLKIIGLFCKRAL